MARPRAADYEDKRRAILDRSAALFAERGIDRASMAEIARACGVSKALLYHYYDSKDALLFDMIVSQLTDLERTVAGALREPDTTPADRLRRMIRDVVALYGQAENLHKVQLNGVPMLPPDMRAEVRVIERTILDHITGLVRDLNPRLDDEGPLSTPMTMSIMGLLNWVYMWFRDDGALSREAYADAVADMILNGLTSMR